MYIYTPVVCIAGVETTMPHGTLHMITTVMHYIWDMAKDIIKQAKSIGYCPTSRK